MSEENFKLPCKKCGYDLTGSPVHCPECGRLTQRYTERARTLIESANRIAIAYFNNETPFQDGRWHSFSIDTEPSAIRPFHSLVALLMTHDDGVGVGLSALRACGYDTNKMLVTLLEASPKVQRRHLDEHGRLRMSHELAAIIEWATDEAMALSHIHIGTEHITLALLRKPDNIISWAMSAHGVRAEAVRDCLATHYPPVR